MKTKSERMVSVFLTIVVLVSPLSAQKKKAATAPAETNTIEAEIKDDEHIPPKFLSRIKKMRQLMLEITIMLSDAVMGPNE